MALHLSRFATSPSRNNRQNRQLQHCSPTQKSQKMIVKVGESFLQSIIQVVGLTSLQKMRKRMSWSKKKKLRKLAIESLESRRVMATLPYGAETDDTGEFLLGRVAVTPVFLESDGTIDASTENWTQAQINQVLSNIQTGLNWWTQLLATKSSVHTLEWVIDTTFTSTLTPTPYEPIARNSNAYTMWVSKFLSDVGFSASTNLETNVRAFNNAQRAKLDTDWSFTIFVVNSQNDGDGSFAPGGAFSRAFAFAGGLFEVVPSTRPASTYAHETGHMFWARDEYIGGGNYTQRRGYYNSQNTNAIDLNPTQNFQQELSIMSAGSTLQTAYDTLVTADATLAQLGWRDSDQDGIFDLLDVPLLLEGTGRLDVATNSYRFVGRSAVQTLPNRNSSGTQNDITINKVGRIEYRIEEGPWTTLSTPNQYTVNLDLNIPLGRFNSGRIEIRAIDPRTGITSNVFQGELGATPDTTTKPGIQGFVWADSDRNNLWGTDELGLAGASVTVVDNSNRPVVFQTIVEPDNFLSGIFNNTVNGVRIDAIGDDTSGTIGIFEDSGAPTGVKIFKPFAFSAGNYVDAFRGNSQQLRARFDNPNSFVSIDAKAVADNTDVRIDAYAADGTLLKRVEKKGLINGEKVTLEIGTDTAQIASVIVRGFDNSYIKLDNFRFGPKNTAVTASDGSYFLPYLPAGTYNLFVQPGAPGYTNTNPSSGIQNVVLASNQVLSHVDFGLKREASPWQNQRLNEDVDNNSAVDPLDVLMLINEINRAGSRALDGSGQSSPPYFDVNGDRSIGPIDVLQIINYINRSSSGGGEGETTPSKLQTASQSLSPFPSFVQDRKAAEPTTRIVSSSDSIGLVPNGPDRCGCPACTSFAPSGESSPAIVDIVLANKSKRQIATAIQFDASKNPFESLSKYLDSWDV